MRINNEMRRHRDTVDKKTIKGETYNRGSGSFIMNGAPLLRATIEQADPRQSDKYLLCGTCGVLLSTTEVTACLKCKQETLDERNYLLHVADDWMAQRVKIQHQNPGRFVRRRDLTDEVSTVTSAAETHMEAEEAFEQQCKLSISSRLAPSNHKLTAPVDVGAPYKKFLSGFGMQEPWEKVYSQGERKWLPSRASMSRQKALSENKVKATVVAPEGSEKLHMLNTKAQLAFPKPEHAARSGNNRSLKVGLRREPSLR